MTKQDSDAERGRSELNRVELFGKPPLIKGEDESLYNDLLSRASAAVMPRDIFEEIWVREIVDLSWEVFRWRRLKAALITASMGEGVQNVLKSVTPFNVDPFAIEDLSKRWMKGEAGARSEVDMALRSAGLDPEALRAQTLAARLSDVADIDQLAIAAEKRRDATLREIDRHRNGFGRTLRKAVEIDAEYQDVTTQPAVG